MNFALLWIDALIISLLWVAALAAFVGRLKRKWIRVVLSSLVVLAPVAVLGAFVASAAMMKFSLKLETNWFGYASSLLLGYVLGTALILRCASRREPGLAPAAATWARPPLVLAWLTAMVVGYMVLGNMDLAIRARCAILSVRVNSLYLATLPAITSDSQNAAPIYEKAFARLRDASEAEMKVHNPPTGDHTDDQFDPDEPATLAFLNQQSATITLLRQAAAMPACRFDQDLSNPDITEMIAGLNEERNAANVLNLHAREEIAHGRAAPAIDDAAALIGMSRHFARRPLLVSALIGAGIDSLGNHTLEAALPTVKNRDDLAALHLEELPSIGRVCQQALLGEESFALLGYGNTSKATVQRMQGNVIQVPDFSVLSSRPGLAGTFLRVFILDLDAHLKLMEAVRSAVGQPYYQVRDQTSQVLGLNQHGDWFTSMVAPSYSRLLQVVARAEASDACAQAAVAMTRFRLDHGALPSHLDDLVPAYLDVVPTGPFDGKPLRLAINGDRWIVYCVGPDGVDHGGVEMQYRKGDVIFTLRPARMATTTTP
jgi:hypothetical protein